MDASSTPERKSQEVLSMRACRRATSAVVPLLAGIVSMIWTARAEADHIDCGASPWGCLGFGAWIETQGPQDGERVTVFGDSLIQLLEDSLADQLATGGFRAFTYGAGGAAYWHWNNGLIVHGQDMGQLAAANAAEHGVLALGANDARVLASGGVSHSEVADQILWGMTRADSGSSGCVILIQPASHGTASYNQAAAQVRDIHAFLAAVRNNQLGTTRFVTADWHGYSASHEDWFAGPEDIHHTAEGQRNYRNFITLYLALARNGSFGC
jgi:hypothetical protein